MTMKNNTPARTMDGHLSTLLGIPVRTLNGFQVYDIEPQYGGSHQYRALVRLHHRFPFSYWTRFPFGNEGDWLNGTFQPDLATLVHMFNVNGVTWLCEINPKGVISRLGYITPDGGWRLADGYVP